MNANERELILKDEVYQIVGAAMEVSNQLGCGFLEAVYQDALEIELAERRIPHVPQKRIAISYNGRAIMIVDVNIGGEKTANERE